MKSIQIPFPEVKSNYINIPYRSGNIDATDMGGYTPYNDRKNIKLEFVGKASSYTIWRKNVQDLAQLLHGQSLKMITDDDHGYYYVVRLKVETARSNNVNYRVVLSGVAEPFKYEKIASNEPWEWDPFDFVTGVINMTDNVEVDKDHPLTIGGRGVPTTPEFIVNMSAGLILEYKGNEYPMSAIGRYRLPQIKVGSEDVTFTFKGSGRISVIYRGRFL